MSASGIDEWLGAYRSKRWDPYLSVVLRRSSVRTGSALGAVGRDGVMYSRDCMDAWDSKAVIAGNVMEQLATLIHETRDELEASKVSIQSLANEVRAVYDVIGPELLKQAKELRAARMNVVAETRDSLAAMKDVRKFFLESDYELEMARLERFVALCREIQALKASGVFDAVCEATIRMALKEPAR